MKAKIFNPIYLLALLFIATTSGFAAPITDDASNKEQIKTYSKSYPADGNDKLQIDNRYGKVTVNTWAKNEFKVDVQIKISTNDADDTKNMLDKVTISDSKDGSTVSFKTNIGKQSYWGSGKSTNMEINYIVYMPAKNPLAINNKYGVISLPNLDGKVEINVAYGNLIAKALTNDDNHINAAYGTVNIESLRGKDIDVKYGSLILGSVDKLTANIDYSSVKIGKLNTFGDFNVKFGGGFQIADLDKNFKSLSIASSYTGVSVGLSGDENADFNVTVKYGSFNQGTHAVNIEDKTPEKSRRGWSPTQNYTGHLGKGSSEKVINITSSFGSVKFD